MIKFCTFCARKLDSEGFCTNPKCPDYRRKEIVKNEQIAMAKEKESTAKANNNKA